MMIQLRCAGLSRNKQKKWMRRWNSINQVKAVTILQRFTRRHTKDMRVKMQASLLS